MNQKRELFNNILIILSVIGFLSALVAFAYMGSFMRIIGDDYCHGAVLTKYGFWSAQAHAYLDTVPFHGDRYSLTFFSTLIFLFPPVFNGVVPSLMITLFSASIFCLLHAVSNGFKLSIPFWVKLLISLSILFFTLLITPTVTQSLYWRSGMLSTLPPIIGSVFLVTIILSMKLKKGLGIFIILIYSIINAGFSENGAAFQSMAAAILLLLGLYLNHKKIINEKMISLLSGVAIIGSVIGVMIMWFSPSIDAMQEKMSINLFASLMLAFRHTLDFFSGAFTTSLLGVIAMTGFGILTFFLLIHSQLSEKLKQTRFVSLVGMILISQFVTLLLIFSVMLPSALTRSAYPDPRHLIGPAFSIVSNLVFSGFIIAAILHRLLMLRNIKLDGFLKFAAAIAMLLFSLAYPVRYITSITSEKDFYRYWAFQWDSRHNIIEQSVDSGEMEVHVMTLDKIIEDVRELSADPQTNWYNGCAAEFYQLNQIFADQPGWEEGFREFVIKP